MHSINKYFNFSGYKVNFHPNTIHISYLPSARAVQGEYRSEVLTVQKRPKDDILPVRSRAILVNKRFITLLKRTFKIVCKCNISVRKKMRETLRIKIYPILIPGVSAGKRIFQTKRSDKPLQCRNQFDLLLIERIRFNF